MPIRKLEPKSVWNNFYSLTQIPRPSGHTQKVAKFLVQWAKDLGMEAFQDECGNVIIRKPATPGMEDRKGIVLQAHMDMVPQKNNDKKHDFTKDPIETRIVHQDDGDWVYANGTTLGADDGLGVAAAMSVLESKTLKHGPLEALFTVDEETRMVGAKALKPGVLKGDILLNLDSETEGELYVGCAGGLDANVTFKYKEAPMPKGYKAFQVIVTGLRGGHSGMEINEGRGNANKVMARVLLPMVRHFKGKLVSFNGGNMRNAIPREAEAIIAYVGGVENYFSRFLAIAQDDIDAQYHKWSQAPAAVGTFAANHPITLGKEFNTNAGGDSYDQVANNSNTASNTHTGAAPKGWRLPSVTDWRYIFQGMCKDAPSATNPVGIGNGDYYGYAKDLAEAINHFSEWDVEDDFYWTSSEYVNEATCAWCYEFNDSGMSKMSKTTGGFVRAVFAY